MTKLYEENGQLMFGAIIKNSNIDEGNIYVMSIMSYMEPKHKFECPNCDSTPWVEI